jgi:GNAT superfamily N-acetyltransferase
MEEYRTKAKEFQNYELEHDTYQDKATSYRDVEQLVLKINQSASAAEIIGEDEMMKFFLGQVAQGSVQSGHPVSPNTVGWLRVDFINDQWLLVDEIQSDLINGVDLAKRFISEPTLETLMSKYKSETVKQKIRDMGATEQMFQHSKQEFARRGYTIEKLDDMRQSLVNLFKDWAEYGIASLIEIARRNGIQNVAIHTGQSIAKRDPDLEADKAVMFYDQLAKSFGFKKQPLDIGDLKGEFWVRTASKKASKDDTTSMTLGINDEDFPSPVLIRWEQGMRWRQVLKSVKTIVGEIAGKRVAWRDIYIWASLWGTYDEQQNGWQAEKAKGTRVMFDVLHNGAFVSVGAPYQAEAVGATVKEADHRGEPESDTNFHEPEYGTENNAYAVYPEKVMGDEIVPDLETLAPQEFEKHAVVDGVRYTLDIHDSHRGELFGKVEALLGDDVVGYVQFSEATADIPLSDTRYWTEEQDEYGGQQWAPADDFPREVHIKYVQVNPQYRRQGIGTGMYEKIKQEFPGEKIVSSGTTDEGGKFRRKLTERGVLAKKAGKIGPVYHGTGEAFEEYHSRYGLYYFTDDPQYAELFTNRVAPGKTLEGANIRRAYITLDNPFDARSWGNETQTITDIVDILGMEPDEALGYNTYQGAMPFWQWVRNYPAKVKEVLTRQGYDGIIQDENHPGAGYASATAYIVFNTNQIKWTLAKGAAGPVKIEEDMYKNFKLKLEYSWHEYGDDVDDGDWNMVIVNAFDTTKSGKAGFTFGEDGKWAGSAEFVIQDGHLRSANTEVEKEYQRQGLATAMYVFAEEEIGMKTVPHNDQTPAGQKLWRQKDRPFGMSWASALLKRTAGNSYIPTLADAVNWGLNEDYDTMGPDQLSQVYWDAKLTALPEEQQEQAVRQIIQEMWSATEDIMEGFQFPLVVYRGIGVDKIGDLELERPWHTGDTAPRGVGESWTYDESSEYVQNLAEHGAPNSNASKIVVLRGEVGAHAINWESTAYHLLVWVEEKEVALRPGATVKITGWRYMGESKWRVPQKRFQTVTAAYAEGQNQVQHTDHEAVGMSKTLKSDPFAVETETLALSLGKQPPPPNPDAPQSEALKQVSLPQAEGEENIAEGMNEQ